MKSKHHVGLREHEIQRQILDWLKLKHIMHWRSNTGAMAGSHKGKRWYVKFGPKGGPDIFAVIKGQIFGIEVKAHDGFQSQVQKEFEVEFTRTTGVNPPCGIYVLAWELGHVVTALTDAMREKMN